MAGSSGVSRSFRALSRAVDVRPGLDPDVGAGQAGELGDSQAGLDGEGEHGVVAAAGPGVLVAGGQERVGLVRGQVGDVGAVAALAGDGQDPLDQRAVLGMAQGGVGEQGVDRRQAGVAGPGAVAPVGLQVLQERGDHPGRRGRRGRARSGSCPSPGGGEAEQQPERVAVGGDRGGAGVALADQPAGEELLQDGSEVTHRRPPSAAARAAASCISSGTAEMYQYVPSGVVWPRYPDRAGICAATSSPDRYHSSRVLTAKLCLLCGIPHKRH